MLIYFPSEVQYPIKSSSSTSTSHFKHVPCQGLTPFPLGASVPIPHSTQCHGIKWTLHSSTLKMMFFLFLKACFWGPKGTFKGQKQRVL